MMKLYALSSVDELLEKADVICVPCSKEKAELLHSSLLSRIIPEEVLPPVQDITQNKGTIHVLYGQHRGHKVKIYLACEGDTSTEANIYSLAKKLAIKARPDLRLKGGLIVHHLDAPAQIQSAFAGWTAGHFDLGIYKQQDPASGKSSHDVYTFLGSEPRETALEGITLGLVQQEVMQLVNTPSSHKSPAWLGAWASRSAAQHGYEARVIDKQQLLQMGMHALLAVNRGSEHPAQCIVSHYKHPEATRRIALIGKGVIFDTGGISIKDSKNMHYMKSDMAGAAAALATIEACARLKLKVDIVGIAPATDNSIDGLAIKPGDVIQSFAGKTIEVLDTDAEGRLILADALAYAIKEYQPDVIIDLATLTGNIVMALGPQAAGLFTKNDDLASSLEAAGKATGERVWRMPMFDEYHDDMVSDIADIKNLSEKPYAGAITATKFLEVFTSEHPAWAHLDIAGMGFQPNGFGKGYCATGYGVRLLVKWLTQS